MDSAFKLEEAILFAVRAHLGQRDFHDEPHILHVLRVMNRVRRAGGNEEAMTVAVLHDVVEDTGTNLDTISALFGIRIAGAVGDLTHLPAMNYTDYIRLISQSRYREVVVLVKLCDLADNLQRGKENPLPAKRQKVLTERYKAARKYLKSLPLTGGTQC